MEINKTSKNHHILAMYLFGDLGHEIRSISQHKVRIMGTRENIIWRNYDALTQWNLLKRFDCLVLGFAVFLNVASVKDGNNNTYSYSLHNFHKRTISTAAESRHFLETNNGKKNTLKRDH